MQNLLVVGADSVVGANAALSLAERYTVTTQSFRNRVDLPHCGALDPSLSPQQALAAVRPDWVIHCGPASHSSWDPGTADRINDRVVDDAAQWAAAANAAGCALTYVSSDAVFTSPWLFHDEESPALCGTPQAKVLRIAEQQVQECHRQALIIRTNVFGWSAESEGTGWLERLLADIQTHRVLQQDPIRHATPILATDLVEILERAFREGLSGVYHVGGAERVSPMKFAQRLADQFNLPWLSLRREGTLSELPQGFGAGECSLQTKKIRKALCVAMPLLSEGLARLHAQSQSGYCDRLSASRSGGKSRAA